MIAELYKMVCSENSTFTDITIPSVMLPKAAGNNLEDALNLGKEGTNTSSVSLVIRVKPVLDSCTDLNTEFMTKLRLNHGVVYMFGLVIIWTLLMCFLETYVISVSGCFQ